MGSLLLACSCQVRVQLQPLGFARAVPDARDRWVYDAFDQRELVGEDWLRWSGLTSSPTQLAVYFTANLDLQRVASRTTYFLWADLGTAEDRRVVGLSRVFFARPEEVRMVAPGLRPGRVYKVWVDPDHEDLLHCASEGAEGQLFLTIGGGMMLGPTLRSNRIPAPLALRGREVRIVDGTGARPRR